MAEHLKPRRASFNEEKNKNQAAQEIASNKAVLDAKTEGGDGRALIPDPSDEKTKAMMDAMENRRNAR